MTLPTRASDLIARLLDAGVEFIVALPYLIAALEEREKRSG